MSKSVANFWHALIAVIAGNAAYFLVEKYLPVAARHVVFKMDVGMVVDFWFCLVAFGVVKTLANWRGGKSTSPPSS
jgi:cytosine/uracil/thiamine/allantoin permease